MGNYYDKIYDSTAYSIEQATLAEDLKFSELKPLDGKFYLKVLTPLVKSDEISVKQKLKLTSANYVTLTIPTYLLIQFMNVEVKTIKIPKQNQLVPLILGLTRFQKVQSFLLNF